MDQISAGELVTVTGNGPQLDGIVFDTPSATKVVVAVLDPAKGPVFRSVGPKALTVRTEPSNADGRLQMLIRRTPATVRGGSRGGEPVGGHGGAGFKRKAAHRSTGK